MSCSTNTQLDIVPFDCCSFGRCIKWVFYFTVYTLHARWWLQTNNPTQIDSHRIVKKKIDWKKPRETVIIICGALARTIWAMRYQQHTMNACLRRYDQLSFNLPTHQMAACDAFNVLEKEKKKTRIKSNMIKETIYTIQYSIDVMESVDSCDRYTDTDCVIWDCIRLIRWSRMSDILKKGATAPHRCSFHFQFNAVARNESKMGQMNGSEMMEEHRSMLEIL